MNNTMSFLYPVLTEKHLSTIQKCFLENDISFPKENGSTRALEEKLKQFFGVDYLLTMNNGTSTLHSAFFAIGDGFDPSKALEGKELLCPSYTWWASILPAINCGATINFVEINEETLTVDPQDLEKKINSKTAAIVIPHLFGQVSNLDEICRISKSHHIPVIEDASHVLGSYWRNKPVGTLFDIGCFSMQAGKPLCAGEGGIFLTKNKRYYERALLLGHYERARKELTSFVDYAHIGLGFKYRISPLSAALACVEFDELVNRLKKENELHKTFYSALEKIPFIKVPRQKSSLFHPGGHFSYRFLIDLENFSISKENLISTLNKRGVPLENEFYPLLHTFKVFEHRAVNFGYGKLARTEALYRNSFAMPVFRVGTSTEAILKCVETLEKTLLEFRKK